MYLYVQKWESLNVYFKLLGGKRGVRMRIVNCGGVRGGLIDRGGLAWERCFN